MKILFALFALTALFVRSQSQFYIPVLYNISHPALNHTQWKPPALNNTQWKPPAFNQSHWGPPALNFTTLSGDVIIGQIGYLDRLLFNQIYYKPRRSWSGREKIIEYPKDMTGKHNYETINSIRIYNKFYDGLDSKAKILSGGVGSRFVKIKLSSKRNKGFKYLVQIFGH
ncbi:hypothetical protein TcasGA2_TC004015 [Tribolium castaneum]|uniref:Uncharacterized protein n=1 Tax=Tribolium castaneum TaxID=7070 RepID=D6WIT5_TRICA|nr:PREDICTED: uncharacterized protein LOC655848 [Tribolium castaneum]EFA01092.1 hypothetical protein TcasGA2_TC004015 [Tribolium castaneum]|eukprot:XP_976138.1 PREDICTED: uncharacterized protein LOC655848 [Tribolium castaneum]